MLFTARIMTLKFRIEYFTRNNEYIALVVEGQRGQKAYPMVEEYGVWECQIKHSAPSITYHYELRQGDTTIRSEWGEPHHIANTEACHTLHIHDHWRTMPDDRALRSTMFTDSIFARERHAVADAPHAGEVLVRADIAAVAPDCKVILVGEGEALGGWDISRGVEMNDVEFPIWSARVPKSEIGTTLTFKCVIVKRTGEVVAWQSGENSRFEIDTDPTSCTIIDSLRPHFEVKAWRGAGVAVPLFSLRSEQSFGVGEFRDIRLLVDWAVVTGQKIIQLLPINDTTMTHTWADSYPYNANSTFALHPQHLHLQDIALLHDAEAMARYEALGRELNTLETVDYERVNNAKRDYLHAIYRQEGDTLFTTQEFRDFLNRNIDWLRPYAVYCALRDEYRTADFRKWGKWAKYSPRKVAKYAEEHSFEVGFNYFVQYHLAKQLREARDYAHAHGVVLKGDIPIGISRTSVDAWATPELFNMDSSAGAPPDDFSVLGQNWGFPTYNWAKMAEDNYAWWRARFAKMAEYFDAYRIDHILGFFRIWEIPLNAKNALLGHFNPALPLSTGETKSYGFRFVKSRHTAPIEENDDVLFIEDTLQKGYYHPRIAAQKCKCYQRLSPEQREAYDHLYEEFYYHRHNDFWREEALRKLPPLIASTGMLVCGEDLGMIPACVASVMASEQILSLEVQRMPKEAFAEFGEPMRYPYLAVATTSTHDMTPLRAWWEESEEVAQHFWEKILKMEGKAPRSCEAEICRRIIEQHLASPAMLAILPLQDWLSISDTLRHNNPHAERINDPSNPHHRWCYRMHLTLEQLLSEKKFNEAVRKAIEDRR